MEETIGAFSYSLPLTMTRLFVAESSPANGSGQDTAISVNAIGFTLNGDNLFTKMDIRRVNVSYNNTKTIVGGVVLRSKTIILGIYEL